ncbi:MAG: tRNA 2-thiouridine(34) synthase MnmA, partial [Nitrospirae bacterium CG_4_10_14_3_um_filter_70_108]
QRRHLGIAAAAPCYVVALRPATNEVVVGPAACLDHRQIEVEAMNWLAPPPANGHCTAQIRATAPATAATFEAHGDRLRLTFATPVRAPAPGQTVALFIGDRLLGGGTLARVVE